LIDISCHDILQRFRGIVKTDPKARVDKTAKIGNNGGCAISTIPIPNPLLSMPLFLLIRHGENEYVKTGRLAGRLPDVHLNDQGRAQAQAVAEKLAGASVKALYTSPMERARETAAPIARTLGLEAIVREGLTEVDCGDWTGKTLKSLRRLRLWRTVQRQPAQFRFPGGETFVEAQQRIVAEIDALCARHDPKDLIICVSHADPIRLAVAYYLGLPLDNFQRLAASTASMTALQLGEGGGRLLTLNYDVSLSFPKA
jgi:probable phosphoglycerate mutase